MLLQYFYKKENNQRYNADKIYIKIVKQSKDLINNNDYFLFKNFKSSFEVISIITIFYLKNIKKYKILNFKSINENIVKNLINDLDQSLRESGIGDMSIGKYVKSYVKKFYFRLSKLDSIFEDYNDKNFSHYLKDLSIIKKDKISLVLSIFKKIEDEIGIVLTDKN